MDLLTLVSLILVAPPLLYILNSLMTSNPEPLLGKYSQRGRWYGLKYWAFYAMMKLRKRNHKPPEGGGETGLLLQQATTLQGYGVSLYADVAAMDKAQPMPPPYLFPKVGF